MSVRRHLSYANVVATMALVFAMGGTAVAAKHYLISSTSQISPQVLKALEVKIASRVKPGSAGAEGAPGKEGPAGKEGKEGAAGKEGTDGDKRPRRHRQRRSGRRPPKKARQAKKVKKVKRSIFPC